MKSYNFALVFIGVVYGGVLGSAQTMNVGCKPMLTRPNITQHSSSSAMMSSWICDVVVWRCELKKWISDYLETCDDSEMVMLPTCPDYEAFECACGDKICQFDDFECEICMCEGGKFKNPKTIQMFYGKEMMLYRSLMEKYQSCQPKSSGCKIDDNDSGSGDGGSGMSSGDGDMGSGGSGEVDNGNDADSDDNHGQGTDDGLGNTGKQ